MSPAKARSKTVDPGRRRSASAPKPSRTANAPEPCDVRAPIENITAPDDETLAGLAKALGHPARIAILRLLLTRDACVTGDVVAELPLAQSTVSEHLRILREAGLIQGEIDGPRTKYCVSATGLAALKAGVATL